MGFRGAVATHHHQSALAAYEILEAGGNAVDAGVGAVLVEGVVNPHMHGPAGECPILLAGPGLAPTAVNGNTMAPTLASVEAYRSRGLACMPDEGVLAAGVPASLSALLTALQRFGSMPLHRVIEPALEVARHGFAMHDGLHAQEKVGIGALAQKFVAQWPGSAALYLDGDLPIAPGQRCANPRLADVYDTLSARSRSAKTLAQSCEAARDEFYRGSVAHAIDRYSRAHGGLLRAQDLAGFSSPVETPCGVDLGSTTLYKCSTWCQGPALLQTLQILKAMNVMAMEHNSAGYLHVLTEATKLAYADREQWYADPAVVDVPLTQLLSDDYASTRSQLIDLERAHPDMRPGDPRTGAALLDRSLWVGGKSWGAGTVHVDVADASGMMAAFTPSGGWLGSNEVMPELGFPLGNRLMTFYLEPDHHPNLVAPRKRPRTTLSPSLATKDARPWLAFGSMGADQQDQWQLQLYLNIAVFGMTPQQAIEAPKCSSEHFDGFFAPHTRFPQRLRVENAVDPAVIEDLTARGHEIDLAPMWTEGYINAVARDPHSGCLEAAADPRGARGDVFPATALAW
ncbi:MAG: gamma-glutamyltransferase family protein [Gammaproteobacteria bacterium]